MPFFTNARHDAMVYYLQCVRQGLNARKINWKHKSFQDYTEEHYKDRDAFSLENKSSKADKKKREYFITTTRAFSLGADDVLQKDGKKVIRPSEYIKVLQELHDESGHPGIHKLRKIVS